MRLKIYLISYILFLVIFISLTPHVKASDYEIGVEEGNIFIWNCHVCDNNKLDDILGEGWDNEGFFEDLEEGTRMKWKIRDTDDDQKIYSSETKDNSTTLLCSIQDNSLDGLLLYAV